MKDIVITSKRIKRERNIYLVCLVLSFAINIAAIATYSCPWTEMFTQIGYVFAISIFIYFTLWVPRILIAGIRHLLKNKK